MWPYGPISDWALGGGGGRRRKTKTLDTKREFQFPIPTGDQAAPRYDPKWDPENDKGE
jgi:hypothetical protein